MGDRLARWERCSSLWELGPAARFPLPGMGLQSQRGSAQAMGSPVLHLGSVSQGNVGQGPGPSLSAARQPCPRYSCPVQLWHGRDSRSPSWSREHLGVGGLFVASWVPSCDDPRSDAKDTFNVLFAFKNTTLVCINTWQEAAPPHQWFPGDG